MCIIEYGMIFKFIFYLHLKKIILGITNKFYQSLQKTQDIQNILDLLKISKSRL